MADRNNFRDSGMPLVGPAPSPAYVAALKKQRDRLAKKADPLKEEEEV